MSTETSKNIYQRLHAVMGDVSYVQKEEKMVNNQYRFVSHDGVTAAVRPALLKNGVIYFPQNLKTACETFFKKEEKWANNEKVLIDVTYTFTTVHMDVEFVNIDKPEEKILVPSFGYGIDNQDKGAGKAMSYAVKYALLKALGLETGDDPERDNLDHTPEKREFTREDKMRCRDLAYDLAHCKTVKDVEQFLEENLNLPDLIGDSAVSRIKGLKSNVSFPPAKYGFIDVQEALEFGTLAKKNIEEGPIEGLENWLFENHHKIKALDAILTAKKYNENGTPSQRLDKAYTDRINPLNQAAE